MTEFRGITSGATITTKNNMNNVMLGNKIEIVGEAVCRVSEDSETEQICKEVLKRFKDYKERKEK